ncbi:MAG: hypothetical protein Q8K18_09120 [Burkholderiales bacterium]|nr:hypothetical protein [Burkholderiales bacterium]
MTTTPQYDRTQENVGNIIALEHVNLAIPDQRLAQLFYAAGMGFTRDPYMMVGDENMWINLGHQQFHLPTRGQHVLRGHVGLVVPDLEALKARLSAVRAKLVNTRFGFTEQNGYLAVNCPWGNRLHCFAPSSRFGDMTLGMPYVEFNVPRGAAPGIARFYEQAFGVASMLAQDETSATIPAGRNQALIFRENDAPLPPYDGHHIAIYVADFSGPHHFLKQHDLISEESDQHQYRFRDIFDLETGAKLFEIEHEVRSLRHPLWGRTFINRNPEQTQRGYMRDRDAFAG